MILHIIFILGTKTSSFTILQFVKIQKQQLVLVTAVSFKNKNLFYVF